MSGAATSDFQFMGAYITFEQECGGRIGVHVRPLYVGCCVCICVFAPSLAMSTASELEYIQFGDILFSSALGAFNLLSRFIMHILEPIDAEIRLIWKRSRNSSRYLFLFNRYLAFFGNIAAAYPVFSSSLTLSRIFIALTQAIVTGILILRVYALYGCRRWFLVCFLGVLALGTATSIILVTVNGLNTSNLTSLSQGCRNVSEGAKMAIGWEGILLLDTILFALTLLKGYHHRLPIGTSRLGVSLFAVVVRDGSIYFFIMASLNLVNIISFYTPGRLQGNISNFVGCTSVTLMSRMMLDLHEAAELGIYTTNAHALTQDIWVNRDYGR
ncbi:hypothetical protein C8J55DRAFT_489364 [Lentinula edodes]|uniref:DUF6533 domain-containing protein n=1 Tax=Lentinula lateritia TaxID=40482 RepID=A0A9W9ADX9_9AGAR|nr:hypothetical protein C8J55DRAFT_489364 [Lentinula edodes]